MANLSVSVDAVSLSGTPISDMGLGDDYRYRATIHNSGPGTATGVQLQELIDLEHNIVAAPTGCVLPAVAPTGARFGTVTCAIAPLASGANAVVVITVEGRLTCTRWGNSANNSITGTASGDVLCGGGGADTITGLGRADTIYGFGPTGSVSATASVTWAGGGPVPMGPRSRLEPSGLMPATQSAAVPEMTGSSAEMAMTQSMATQTTTPLMVAMDATS